VDGSAGRTDLAVAVGVHDLIIAATAIAAGFRVATRDERSFPRIPGLATVVW
jgi:predicted nucleic acid-binding protein